jgi:hypothetical protein
MILYFLPLLFKDSSQKARLLDAQASIKEIELKKGKEIYRFKKQGDSWQMITPINWKAKTSKIEELIRRLKKTILENPITENKERYGEYGVEEDSDYVKIVKDNHKEITLYTGKRGPRYSLIYIRKKHEDTVYLVNASFYDALPSDRDDFRDKTILSIPVTTIKEIRWELKDKKFSMTKRQDGWFSNEKKLSDDKVRDYLQRVSNITAMGFPEDDKLPEDAELAGKIFIKSTKDYTLVLYKRGDEYYILKDSTAFKISSYIKDDLFREIL